MSGYKQPIPFDIVSKAVQGDSEAIAKVLSHYNGYISKLAKFDVEARCRMESKLLMSIQKFILKQPDEYNA